jgi:AAA family ATP:ADP antiporter
VAGVLRALKIRAGEAPLVLIAFLFHFAVMTSWNVLKPIRDGAGIRDFENMPLLVLAVLGAMIALQPAFAALVGRLGKRLFVPIAYHFFAANLLVLYLLFPDSGVVPHSDLARVFFVWASVFNLFVVSLAWAVVVDVFDAEQSARLFGTIAAASTVGVMAGASLTAFFVEHVGVDNMLLVSLGFLEGALLCATALLRRPSPAVAAAAAAAPAATGRRSGALEGMRLVARSPYVRGIALYILAYTITAQILYFVKAGAVKSAFEDSQAWVSFLAKVDAAQSGVTLFLQVVVAGALLTRFGSRWGLAIVPIVTMLGFGLVGVLPALWLVTMFDITRKATNYGFARPSREMLFTVVGKDEKFKAKSFIETFVYRAGDGIGAAGFKAAQVANVGLAAVAWCMVPIALLWLVIGFRLGRQQERLAEDT